ncbi:EF-hand calcium-binding domain-containing protein 6 isoform X5 [Danio rerio]|uniref:EF-hand calcium-binding domain-containing protein 6 isoform X5 n=1 Tax=Danio rerio TaxID=7955 RepID=A0AC58IV69_DANRE
MRPRSAVESWVSASAQMPQISSNLDLRPMTQGLTIIPRAKSASRLSSGDFSRRNTLKSDSASSVQSVADENLSLVDIENLLLEKVKDRKDDLKAAFEAFDQEGNKTVTKGEFRRVIEGFLVPLTQSQFESLLAQLDLKENGTVFYMEFLRRHCKVSSTVGRIPSKSGRYRNLSLGELQCRLRDKMRGNLKNITRAFRLFDYNNDGQIQQHELRKILEGYCFPMSQLEFHRLWSHYSMNNADTISYKVFLEKLGVDCENYRKIPPDSVQLALNWDAVSRSTTRPKSKTSLRRFSGKSRDNLDDIQIRFLSKMKKDHSLVEKALQAFDISDSGFVSLEDLRSILSNFLFAMDDTIFRELLKRFGVSNTEPVKWKIFLGLFKDDITVQKDSVPATADTCSIDAILSKLRQHVLNQPLLDLDKSATGFISRNELFSALENMNLTDEQFTVLADFLDVDHTDAINCQQFLDLLHLQNPVVQTPKLNEKAQARLNTAITAQNAIEKILKEKISENYDVLMESITNTTQNQNDTISPEDFRRLIQHVLPLSDHHFIKLCEPFFEDGNVNYKLFLKSFGPPEKIDSTLSMIERKDGILDNACDQVHEYLAAIAHKRPSEISKVFCHLGNDCKSIMTKNGLKQLLFKYSMPITPNEFEILWSRYDKENKGFLTQKEFLSKLKITSDEDQERQEQPTATPDLEVMLQNLRKWIGIDFESVSGSLVVLDKNKDGHVTVTDLLSLLHRHGFQLTEAQFAHLLSLLGFDSDLKQLPYLDFLKHLVGPPVSSWSVFDPSQGLPVASSEEMKDGEELSPGRAIQRVKELVTTSSDTLFKAFSAFDRTGDGMIPQAEFRQVLDHFCMRLSDVQFKKLLSELRLNKGEELGVNWKEFLQVFNLHNEETADEWLKKISKMRFPNQTRPLAIGDILRRVQEVVSARIYTITKDMVDLDYANTNTISRSDFKTICDRHFMRLTEEQLQNLWKLLPVNDFGNLEYREFLKKFSGEQKGLDQAKSLPGSARSTVERPASLRRPKTAPCSLRHSMSSVSEHVQRPSTASRRSAPLLNCEDVEMKVRPKIQDCWRHIQRRCRHADPERTGEIDVDAFLGILQGLHIELSPSEFEQLTVKFDIKSNGRVSYPDFLRHFVLMFSPEVNTSSNRLRLQLPTTPMSPGPLSAQCVEAMLRISRPVQLFWRQMRQTFLSFDKERTGKISVQDFRKVLRQFSVNLSEEELFHFKSFFDKNLSGRISYNDFLRIFLK